MEQNGLDFCRQVAISNDYEDFMTEYTSLETLMDLLKPICVQTAGPRFAVYHQVRDKENARKYLDKYGYNAIPKLYGLLDTTSAEASGALRVRRQPYLNLYGNGVILGFVDTGIDYQNPLFINADNTSRILTIWDQEDQSGEVPDGFNYGTEYTREQINQALASENPLDIVPSTDNDGHGTFIAGIAAGGEDSVNDFTGIAPNTDIVMVKLKQGKPYLRELYGVESDVNAFQSNDILLGIQYLFDTGTKYRKPVVVCIGIGSNSGDHTGRAFLSSFCDEYADLSGICILSAAGNEGNLAHHFRGSLNGKNDMTPVEIRVGKDEPGFGIEIWGNIPNLVSVSIVAPTGEVIPRVPAKLNPGGNYNLSFERTLVSLQYFSREDRTGDELVFIKIKYPIEGIWTINVYSDTEYPQIFDAWLPMERFITPNTYFLQPDPDITITQPGNAENPITVSTYNHTNGSIYISSSRGPTRNGRQKPDIAAPGVDVYGPTGRNQYGQRTGSSIAVANLAGAAALLMEWGIVKGNNINLDTIGVRQLLINGANRKEGLTYPNNIWGYGTLDIYNSFDGIRITSV